ncbi:unnamed protein product [Calicophoron daubneyi]|uniref:MAP kinase-activating death domain protein n=1 Tax=Calicophoron daubneyi TaxID=300641 RepID=A0AAV2TNB1_CALDB
MGSAPDFCPRLVDYVVLVGSHSPSRNHVNVQTPVILNRFPPNDHADFFLPPDVALFCQPEGCFSTARRAHQSGNMRTPVSFIFTLTDKESNKVRYGICLNFARPIPRRHGSRRESTSTNYKEIIITKNSGNFNSVASPRPDTDLANFSSKRNSKSSSQPCTHTLTSLCLITHHPFFTKFKALLEFLHMLIHKLHERTRSKSAEKETVWGMLTGANSTATSPLIIRSVHEIEAWILRLLSAPAPVPGKTCVHLYVQPKALNKPMVFALPDKSRLPLVDFPLHLPFQVLGIARALRILVCLLLEQKVVLQSADYNKLSLCVLAFTALLYPLQYMFPIIPLLPPCMADAEQLLIAPTPYIIGVPTAFYTARKVFRMPKDVWLANLDTQELSYPEVMEEIADIPEPECTNLVRQINDTLETLAQSRTTSSLDVAMSEVNQLIQSSKNREIAGYNPLAYITDDASTNVATRVAMILFLNGKNILGGLTKHTRTLRLFPRPVVAFEFESFMKSRPRPCLFTSLLAKTQAVEYFAESSLCAENEAYQSIFSGEYAPELIGDRAELFVNFLKAIEFTVWSERHPTNDPTTNNGSAAEFSGSPLLFALIAARARSNSQTQSDKNTDNSIECKGSEGILLDNLSEDPTDESASDTETEHSTISVASTISDLTSDYLDSGIGEPQNKGIISRAEKPNQSQELDDLSANLDSASRLILRPGEPLPSGLVHYFDPPLKPVLGSEPDEGERVISVNGLSQANVDGDSEESDSNDPDANVDPNVYSRNSSTNPPSSPNISAGETLRALTRVSMSMFGHSPTGSQQNLQNSPPAMISGGRINWNSPLFMLIGELFSIGGNQAIEGSKEFKKRSEDEKYLLQLSKSLLKGNIPNLFTRNRFISMMEWENNRNLVLANLNQNIGLASDSRLSHTDDVPVKSWNQYKALVWTLRQMVSGLRISLHSEISIPTSENIHTEVNTTRTRSADELTENGGLASAFVLLEIAHTHYFKLPSRVERFGLQHKHPSLSALPDVGSQSPVQSPSPLSLVNQPFTERKRTGVDSSDNETDVKNDPKNDHKRSASSGVSHSNRIIIIRANQSSASGHKSTESSGNGPVLPDKSLSSQPSFDLDSGSASPLAAMHRSQTSMSLSTDTSIDDLPPLKSSRSQGYRYRLSRLIHTKSNTDTEMSIKEGTKLPTSTGTPSASRHSVDETEREGTKKEPKTKVDRTFIFEDLINVGGTRDSLWDDLQFWEDSFLDAVAQERDILGMDFRPGELLRRYRMSSALKKKRAELEEDRLLAHLMYNMIAFMVMAEVDRTDVQKKIRRLLAKSHMGLHYSQEIANVLDALGYLYGNDIDLKPMQSRFIPQHSYDVYRGPDTNRELIFIEVCSEFLLLRNISGSIIDRWWYDQVINMTYRVHSHTLCLSIRIDGHSQMNLLYTRKCRVLYHEIQQAMEQISAQNNRGPLTDLGGILNVVNLETQLPGSVMVCPDGFAIKIGDEKMFLGLANVKRCSIPQHDVFSIEYYDLKLKSLSTLKFRTDMALLVLNTWQRMLTVALTHDQLLHRHAHSKRLSGRSRHHSCCIHFT